MRKVKFNDFSEESKTDKKIHAQALSSSMRFGVSKYDASGLKVGDQMTFVVKGKIVNMGEPYESQMQPEIKGTYLYQKLIEITIENPKVIESESNAADQEMRRMVRE